MNVLIVEDDKYKSDAIVELLKNEGIGGYVHVAESLNGGLFYLHEEPNQGLIVLDMSMPSFDISEDDPQGGTPESYAGEEFLAHMELMGSTTPVVVVTQYHNFGPDSKSVTLEQLDKKLRENYSRCYKGYVYFQSTSNSWKNKLVKLLRVVINESSNS